MNLEKLESDECKSEKYTLSATVTNKPGNLNKKRIEIFIAFYKDFTLLSYAAVNQMDERERTASRNNN